MADRELIRCKSQQCPSAKSGGRILMERIGSLYIVELRLGQGQRYKASMFGAWVSITCPSCGMPRLNPDLAASDGLGSVIEAAVAAVSDRATERSGAA